MTKQNILTLSFAATECNGWPQIRVLLNNKIVNDCVVDGNLTVSVAVDSTTKNYNLQIQRYGKTDKNFVCADNQIVKDQVVELVSITVDGIPIPNYIINNHATFTFNDQTHLGSCYFSPNGVWELKFQAPFITWLLDQKILHESMYTDDYKFDWSYKLGPQSVDVLSSKFEEALKKINQIYE